MRGFFYAYYFSGLLFRAFPSSVALQKAGLFAISFNLDSSAFTFKTKKIKRMPLLSLTQNELSGFILMQSCIGHLSYIFNKEKKEQFKYDIKAC